MTVTLIWAGGAVMVWGAWWVWNRYRDPLHPLVYLAPMFVYLHTVVPLVLIQRGILSNLFQNPEKLLVAQAVVTASMVALTMGCLSVRSEHRPVEGLRLILQMSSTGIRRLRRAGYALGLLGLVGYFYRLSTIGGFWQAYSRPKGGGAAPGLSGYITGAALLTIPAMLLLLLAHRERKLTVKLVLILLILAFPHLAQAFLGGSRGNAFLAIASLSLGWYLAKASRPALRSILLGLVLTAFVMFTLKEHRRTIYLGSGRFELNWEKVLAAIVPEDISPEHVSTLTLGTIIAARDRDHYFWGKRYLAQALVRPIPRQIWPRKYHDLGFGWMVEQPGSAGLHPSQWIASVGWFPSAGAATGVIGDAFLEFSWGGVVVCFLVGILYAWIWRNAIVRHGVWAVLYFEACVVSVYLPTQGFATAWFYRFAFLAVPTVLLWRLFLSKHVRALLLRPMPQKITYWLSQKTGYGPRPQPQLRRTTA